VPDVVHIQHENKFLFKSETTRQWLKLRSDKVRRSRKGEARAGIESLSLWTISWHLKGKTLFKM